MTSDQTLPSPYEPRRPVLTALAVFLLAALTLCWPMLQGQFLVGDDQYIAGYGFRLFGAEHVRQYGSIPEWNPYLFGGLPYIAAMHGDIFYPTAWLRWFLPIDTAMNLGFAAHFVLAGLSMFLFVRALRVGWTGAVVAGVGYELSGIVASLVRPGHDGKLFVSALAPLAFYALLIAIRDRRWSGWGLFALTVGLCLLSPHFQMTYYLLVACGLWTLYLTFADPERPRDRPWFVPIGLAALSVVLGLAIAAIQILPFLAYIPFSPRAAGGPSGGWEYATSFSLPPEELVTAILPQFNGILEHYWGRNFFKLHTEYLGVLVAGLAVLAWGDTKRRPLVYALAGIGLLFLLIAFGGHTPFYRLWYEVMPMMKKVRAPGMAFYLFAFPTAVFAGIGTDRLLAGEVKPRTVLAIFGTAALIGLLGAAGGLLGVAQALAGPEQYDRLFANGSAMQAGGIRLLAVALAAGALTWAVATRRLTRLVAATALLMLGVLDLWSIDRHFFNFKGPARQLYADDAVTTQLRQAKPPFRVLDAGVYQGSYLMAHDIMTMLGYHGNELRYYDDLLGGKNVWANAVNPALLDLLAVRFILLGQEQDVPGYHKVLGPVVTTPGQPAVLYERDTPAPYVRVMPFAAKVAEDRLVPTVNDPRFPYQALALYPDTASVSATPLSDSTAAFPLSAELTEWRPGAIRVTLTGEATKPAYLVVAENWYPDWHATVDGRNAPVHRADNTLLSVVVPPGAREVVFEFRSARYRLGRTISWLALFVTAGLIASPLVRQRRAARV